MWSLASNGGFSFHFYIVENESRLPDHTPSYVGGNWGFSGGIIVAVNNPHSRDLSTSLGTIIDTLLC